MKELTEMELRKEYRKEIAALVKKDNNVNGYIELASMLNGVNYKSRKVTSEQLNDLIMFIMNEQLNRERDEKAKRGGII